MKNFIKYFAIIGLIATGLACEKKSSSDESQPTSAPAAELSPAPNTLAADESLVPTAAPLAPSGNVLTTSTVIDRQSTVGETPAGSDAMTWEQIIEMYPALADRVIFLGGIDKVVETDARTIDLYSAGAIVMTLKYTEAGDALVVHSTTHAGFSADLITFETSAAEQSQGAVVDTLDFMMSSCDVAEAPQEQEQAQDMPAKEQEQAGKEVAPTKEQEQASKVQEQEQASKEAPAKEEPKKVCGAIVASLVLKQVVEKQEQAQETKEEPKEVPKEEPKQEAKQEPVAKEEPKAPEQEQKQEPEAPVQQTKN